MNRSLSAALALARTLTTSAVHAEDGAHAAARRSLPGAASQPDRIALELAYGTGGYFAGVAVTAIVTFLVAGPNLGTGTSTDISIGVGSVLYVALAGCGLVLGMLRGAHAARARPGPEWMALGAIVGLAPGAAVLLAGVLASSIEAAGTGGALMAAGPIIGAMIAAEISIGGEAIEPLADVGPGGFSLGARGRF